MKFKYADKRNYGMLVPAQFLIPEYAKEFEKFLIDINTGKEYEGLIDKLIRRNQKSAGQRTWQRYYPIDIDIMMMINETTGQVEYPIFQQSRPEGMQRIIMHFRIKLKRGHEFDYKIPLQCLIKGWGRANNGYQVYVHTLTFGHASIAENDKRLDKNGNRIKELSYVGITGRNWLQRLDEHIAKVRNGAGYMYHQAMRDSLTNNEMAYIYELLDLNLTFEDAMNIEELLVDAWSLAPKGFNLIPGGFRGWQELNKRRLVKDNVTKLDGQEVLDLRDEAAVKLVERELKKGNSKLYLTDWWSNDENYWSAMSAHSKRLDMIQVHKIWALYSAGVSLEQIKADVDALNVRQVKGVVSGKHYNRKRNSSS